MRIESTESDWRGAFSAPNAPGDYTVRVTARVQGKVLGTATDRLQIQSRDLELADPAANPEQLAALAKLTEGAGGRVVPPETLPQLLEELHQRPVVMEIEAESRWRFGDRSLDVWPFFLAFVGLLATEWILRKRWGLQ